MAHFFHPYSGTPLSSIEVISDGQAQIALYGGGPPPDYDDLEVTFVPPRTGSVYPPQGLDVGNNTRLFWINGPSAGEKLHALADGNDYAQTLNVVKVTGHYRAVPAPILQNKAKSECWAAALSAWLQVTPGRPKLSKQQLIDKYADLEDDGLSEPALTGNVVRDFGMGWWAKKSAGYGDLLPSSLIGKLLGHGHLYLIYKSGFQSSHALCVYGVGSRYQNEEVAKSNKEPTISSMDPWYGRPYHRPFHWFYQRPLFIGWPY